MASTRPSRLGCPGTAEGLVPRRTDRAEERFIGQHQFVVDVSESAGRPTEGGPRPSAPRLPRLLCRCHRDHLSQSGTGLVSGRFTLDTGVAWRPDVRLVQATWNPRRNGIWMCRRSACSVSGTLVRLTGWWREPARSRAPGPASLVTGMRYRLEVRLTAADVGKRVVIRWRPGPAGSSQMTDVLGILEQADAGSFAVRTGDGRLVVVPADRALAGKVVPPRRTGKRASGGGP